MNGDLPSSFFVICRHRTGASAASQAYRLPPDVSVPNDIKCGCSEHLEKQEIDLVLNIPAKRAYEILSGECSNYWDRYHAKSNHKSKQVLSLCFSPYQTLIFSASFRCQIPRMVEEWGRDSEIWNGYCTCEQSDG